jgi:hypothetical protein
MRTDRKRLLISLYPMIAFEVLLGAEVLGFERTMEPGGDAAVEEPLTTMVLTIWRLLFL